MMSSIVPLATSNTQRVVQLFYVSMLIPTDVSSLGPSPDHPKLELSSEPTMALGYIPIYESRVPKLLLILTWLQHISTMDLLFYFNPRNGLPSGNERSYENRDVY